MIWTVDEEIHDIFEYLEMEKDMIRVGIRRGEETPRLGRYMG